MADPEDPAGRIEALEARVAYQDETIDALNQTVTAQWSAIEKLKRELAALADRLDDAVSGQGPVERPPPHY